MNRELKQETINNAFSRTQRKSNNIAIYNDYTLVLLNSMHSNNLGVFSLGGIPITNIERTLIDITVRPHYAGGVHSVLEAYTNALDQISWNKLLATLEKLNFIYPYHQAIGFYLERAGYKGRALDELRKKKMEFDFYLTYGMEEKEYSPQWRLFYPKGI